MTLDGAEHELQAEEDINHLMVAIESDNVGRAREIVNEFAADGAGRLAWALLRMARMLHVQEALSLGMERALAVTHDVKPAGLTREQVARVAIASDERTKDEPRRRAYNRV